MSENDPKMRPRRAFLAAAGAGVAGLGFTVIAPGLHLMAVATDSAAAGASDPAAGAHKAASSAVRWGLLIDAGKCLPGCSKCIAPVEEMRRNHMDMLKHQRDRTMRSGIRGEPASLNACIECHASKQTGSVLGSNDSFCQGCHSYAAVKLDCFECHQPRAGLKGAELKR